MTTRTTLLAATALITAATAALALPGGVRAQTPTPAVNGLYIAGSAGVNFLQDERYRQTLTNGFTLGGSPFFNQGFDPGPVGLGSVGYGFGNGLRVELEGSYRYNRQDGRRLGNTISDGGREEKYGPMVNAFYDIPVSFVVQPYVGVGVGYQWERTRERATGSVTGTNLTTIQEFGGTRGSFAVQAMAGVAFSIDAVPGLALTAEYRFMDLTDRRNHGGPIYVPGTSLSGRTRISSTEDYNHSLLIGLRYAFNTAAPLPAPLPTPVTPGPVSSARTFLVFFDWDRADLTPRARQIIAEAARSAQSTQTTRIEVAGHTDLSGTARYNQGLSIRRANAVAAELVRDGVPRGAIVTQGFGEGRPLVPTAQGVREPQNRRVEIVLR